jgi:glycosyltransferase involved in cell wall biosynthesis
VPATNVRVSYLISTRNRARFLDDALQNVREFITPADELIVMDGASTDDTVQIVEANCDIVTSFVSEPDKGEAHGYNKGILASRGRFIKLITDDDYTYPDAMRKALAIMELHPELDAVLAGGEAFELDPRTNEQHLVGYLYLPPSRKLAEDVKNVLDYVSCGLGLILTRQCIERVGLFNTTFRAVDTDYMARLIACNANFKYLNIKLFRHVTHVDSGQNNWPECRRDRLRSLLLNGRWSELFNTDVYPRPAVGEVLGLKALPFGDHLMELVAQGERLRRTPKVRLLIPFLAHSIKVAEKCADTLARFRRFHHRHAQELSSNAEPGPLSSTEPAWDATLR